VQNHRIILVQSEDWAVCGCTRKDVIDKIHSLGYETVFDCFGMIIIDVCKRFPPIILFEFKEHSIWYDSFYSASEGDKMLSMDIR
jgi:hypothetical protein